MADPAPWAARHLVSSEKANSHAWTWTLVRALARTAASPPRPTCSVPHTTATCNKPALSAHRASPQEQLLSCSRRHVSAEGSRRHEPRTLSRAQAPGETPNFRDADTENPPAQAPKEGSEAASEGPLHPLGVQPTLQPMWHRRVPLPKPQRPCLHPGRAVPPPWPGPVTVRPRQSLPTPQSSSLLSEKLRRPYRRWSASPGPARAPPSRPPQRPFAHLREQTAWPGLRNRCRQRPVRKSQRRSMLGGWAWAEASSAPRPSSARAETWGGSGLRAGGRAPAHHPWAGGCPPCLCGQGRNAAPACRCSVQQ